MLRKWPCESASAEMEIDAGDKNDDEVETEVFVGADFTSGQSVTLQFQRSQDTVECMARYV